MVAERAKHPSPQHHSDPSRFVAQEWSSASLSVNAVPLETSTQSSSAFARTGTSEWDRPPSCPRWPSPQHQSEPLVLTAHVCTAPAETTAQSVSPFTSVGDKCSFSSPTPSSPSRFRPHQHQSVPPVLIAHEYARPTETSRQSVSVPTRVGPLEEAVGFESQHSSTPPRMPHVR